MFVNQLLVFNTSSDRFIVPYAAVVIDSVITIVYFYNSQRHRKTALTKPRLKSIEQWNKTIHKKGVQHYAITSAHCRSNSVFVRFPPGSPVIIQEKTNHSSSLHDSVSMNCSVYNSINITWYHGNNRIKQGETYTIFESVVSNKNVSVLSVSNLNCQVAGNYTCVAANDYGSDQRQFTLNILGKEV